MNSRVELLAAHGLAQRRSQGAVLAKNLLTTLRNPELAVAGKTLEEETGQRFRSIQDGEKASCIYRRSIQLVSGGFAMLDDGISFCLVPWRAAMEHRIGREASAIVCGNSISWRLGRRQSIA